MPHKETLKDHLVYLTKTLAVDAAICTGIVVGIDIQHGGDPNADFLKPAWEQLAGGGQAVLSHIAFHPEIFIGTVIFTTIGGLSYAFGGRHLPVVERGVQRLITSITQP
jgi:hypothetical protein